ncbi:ABC-F family ATP-binding cassette domain-containing protein [Halanaerobaculum tunisiense]
MSFLQLREGSKRYPEQIIFQNISLQIQKQDRIGLIGANGTGKSTLLRILAGKEYLDQGEMITSNHLEIGYLAQNLDLELETTLYQTMLSVFADLFKLEERMAELETKMGQLTGAELDKVMKRYSRLREEYEADNGYQIESQIEGVLKGLGFSTSDFTRQLANFSGGQKTRAALAKLLLQQPDLLLLDEPTNHLDLAAKEWLEGYLADYPGAVVIISHDRYFLNQVIDRIWELEKGRFEEYKGDYSFYTTEKEHRLLTWQREYEQQQKKIKEMKDFIRKYKAGIKSKQARGRQKKLDKMEKIPPPPSLSHPQIEFTCDTVSGEQVLEVTDLTKSYPDELVLDEISFKLYRGQKTALVGPNGSGKSTLFKSLLGREEVDQGQIKLGSKVKLGYYDQEHTDLDPDYNLIEELQKVKNITDSQARDILGPFLFQGDDVFKQVATLSGGEKARLTLAKLSIQDLNLLLLDEPTNHLDIKSKERLEEALQNYPGTLLVISHDRYFLDKLVDQIFALEENSLVEYEGNYSAYYEEYQQKLAAQKKAKQQAEEEPRSNQQANQESTSDSEPEIDFAELETKIMELETKLEEIEAKLNQAGTDPEEVTKLTAEYETIQEELEEYYNLWSAAI